MLRCLQNFGFDKKLTDRSKENQLTGASVHQKLGSVIGCDRTTPIYNLENDMRSQKSCVLHRITAHNRSKLLHRIVWMGSSEGCAKEGRVRRRRRLPDPAAGCWGRRVGATWAMGEIALEGEGGGHPGCVLLDNHRWLLGWGALAARVGNLGLGLGVRFHRTIWCGSSVSVRVRF